MRISIVSFLCQIALVGVSRISGASSPPSSSTTTYNVITLVPPNQTVGVIVDDQLYKLGSINEASFLLHSGQAPRAVKGYRYAIVDKENANIIIDQERFSRRPSENMDTTLNEYYNRAWNSMALAQVPRVMEPLPIINRMKSDLHVDGEIPTIHIMGNQAAIDHLHNNSREDITINDINVTYISPRDVKTFYNVSFSIAGHSTRTRPKLSYKLELPDDEKDEASGNNNKDLYGHRRIKLRSMVTDDSYMRDQLAYQIAESIGLPSSQHSYARVYLNNIPIGLFGVVEVFKTDWVRNVFNNGEKFENGALFIADVSGPKQERPGGGGGGAGQRPRPHKRPGGREPRVSDSDLSYLGPNLTLYEIYFPDKGHGSKDLGSNYTKIMEFTKFISEQPNSTTVDNSVVPLWEERIDVTSFLRGLALEIVLSNCDGYLPMANNYILYDDVSSGRLVFSGQDFDLTMGNTFFDPELMYNGNYSVFPGFVQRPLSSRLMKVPKFKQEFEKLIVQMTQTLVNPTVLAPRIDDLFNFLKEDAAWDKTVPRLGPKMERSGFSAPRNISLEVAVYGHTGDEKHLGLKEWIKRRSENTLRFFNQSVA